MCDICKSGLLGELNKKRNWRPDRVVKWASQRGLNIDQKQLEKHFNSHLAPSVNGKKAKSVKTAKPKKASGQTADKPAKQPRPPLLTKHDTTMPSVHPADDQFLNEVVGRVFRDLTAGKFDLKLEHGFKAIEIKQKISDSTNVENMLLELLNEIRTQELTQPDIAKTNQSVQ